jgi:hypothetical protein
MLLCSANHPDFAKTNPFEGTTKTGSSPQRRKSREGTQSWGIGFWIQDLWKFDKKHEESALRAFATSVPLR